MKLFTSIFIFLMGAVANADHLVRWQPVSNAESYRVLRSGQQIATLSSESNSFLDINSAKESVYEVKAVVNGAEQTVSGFVFVIIDSSCTLRWKDNSDDETGFVLERSPMNDSLQMEGWNAIGETRPNETAYIDDTFSGGVGYAYRVKAVRDSSSSGYSNLAYGIMRLGAPESLSAALNTVSDPVEPDEPDDPVDPEPAAKLKVAVLVNNPSGLMETDKALLPALNSLDHEFSVFGPREFDYSQFDVVFIAESVSSGHVAWLYSEAIPVITTEVGNNDEFSFAEGFDADLIAENSYVASDHPIGAALGKGTFIDSGSDAFVTGPIGDVEIVVANSLGQITALAMERDALNGKGEYNPERRVFVTGSQPEDWTADWIALIDRSILWAGGKL